MLVGLLAFAGLVESQVIPGGGGVAIPPSNCFPTDVNPCCWATYTSATVSGLGPAIITDPGVTSIWYGPWVTCDNCRPVQCTDNCDDTFPIRICNAGLGITATTSATATLNSGLDVSAANVVKASLGLALGVTVGSSVTITADCPIPTLACETLRSQVRVTIVAGRKAEVNHYWNLQGLWVSHRSCGTGTCPLQGGPWNDTCPATSSIGIADIEDILWSPIEAVDDDCHLCV